MEVKLFDTTVDLNDNYCQLNDLELLPVEEPYINLYVQNKGCNANCGFCEYKDIGEVFNFTRFELFLKELSKQIDVRKISFTGGEPTLDYNRFKSKVELAKEYLSESFFVVNTNGVNLKKIVKHSDYKLFNSVALSRHSNIDADNNQILGFSAPSTSEITELLSDVDDKNVFHFSCNVIKDYVDSSEKIYNYLEWCSSLGINDVGFVSLMEINQYAKDHFIDFDSLDVINDRFVKLKEWNKKDSCRCNNYLYIPYNNEIIKVYNRHVYSKSNANNFIWDGSHFRRGFNGKIIY